MAFANLVVEVGLNGSAFERGVSKVIAKAREMNAAFGKSVTAIASNQISQAFAVAAVVNKMQAGVSEAIAFGSSIIDLSKKLNVGTDSLQLWNYAATQNGATLGSVDEMFTKLAINSQIAVNGNLEMVAAFKKLGITIDDVKNKKPEEIARLIGKTFESGVNPNSLVGSLRAVGGRGADALISAFEKGIGATFDEGLQLGIVINADELAKIDALGDRLDVIQMQMRPVFFGIAIVLANVAESIYDSVRLLTAGVMDLMDNFTDPGGFKNIKNLELRKKVTERANRDLQFANTEGGAIAVGGLDAKQAVDAMRSEKMDELNKLNDKKRNDINSTLKKAAEQGVNQNDPMAQSQMQSQMATIDAIYGERKDELQNQLNELFDKNKSDIDFTGRKDELQNQLKDLIDREQKDIDSALREVLLKYDPATNLELNSIKTQYEKPLSILQAELKALTDAYVEPFSAVSMLVQEKIDQINAEAKALEEAAAKRLETKRNKPLVNESIPKKLRPVAAAELLPKITDSLAKIGGFTMGRDVISLTVAKQQLAVLETIADNTKDIKPPEGDGL